MSIARVTALRIQGDYNALYEHDHPREFRHRVQCVDLGVRVRMIYRVATWKVKAPMLGPYSAAIADADRDSFVELIPRETQ